MHTRTQQTIQALVRDARMAARQHGADEDPAHIVQAVLHLCVALDALTTEEQDTTPPPAPAEEFILDRAMTVDPQGPPTIVSLLSLRLQLLHEANQGLVKALEEIKNQRRIILDFGDAARITDTITAQCELFESFIERI